MNKIKNVKEWFVQSEYDIDTAKIMFKSGRYIYCVFMCHLSIEKALKSLYVKKFNKTPPKIHSLVYLAKSIELQMDDDIREVLENLDEISVPTRYPDELKILLKEYDKARTLNIYEKSKGVWVWLKKKLEK